MIPVVPFNSLRHADAEIEEEVFQAIRMVYNSHQFIMGPQLAAFEEEYAHYCGTRYCVGLANGLDALYVALKVLGIGEGDEVIVPANTYIATWLAVTRAGAHIVPVDVNPETMLMEASQVESAITTNTRAILPVHLYGQPCNMTELLSQAEKFQLKVVEDNAQAHGASYCDRRTGSFGHCNATSFYPTKNLGALGDGGAITTNDSELFQKAMVLRHYGSTRRFINSVQGINSRLDELQAAVLRVKLKNLDKWNDERRALAKIYLSALDGVGDLLLPKKESESVFHLFAIRTDKRNELQDYLNAIGIETAVHYPVPPHLQEAYANLKFQKGDFPVSEKIAETILSLPLWIGMGEDQVMIVCNAIKDFYNSYL